MSRAKVLIVVEDEPVARRSAEAAAQEAARSMGITIRVDSFEDGELAWMAFRGSPKRYDLAIVDLYLRRDRSRIVDGMEVVERMRMLRRRFPVIVHTDHEGSDMQEFCERYGRYVRKGMDSYKVLASSIREALEIRGDIPPNSADLFGRS